MHFLIGYSDESFETLTVLVQSLIARWRNAKTEIIRRQTDVKDAFDKLGKFKQSIKKHVTFVENKEKELDSILATQAETSEAIQRKLSKVEGLQKEINSLQDEFVQVRQQNIDHIKYCFRLKNKENNSMKPFAMPTLIAKSGLKAARKRFLSPLSSDMLKLKLKPLRESMTNSAEWSPSRSSD